MSLPMASNIVKLFSPWHNLLRTLCFWDICFSPGVPLEEADAALWEYWPDEGIPTGISGPKLGILGNHAGTANTAPPLSVR